MNNNFTFIFIGAVLIAASLYGFASTQEDIVFNHSKIFMQVRNEIMKYYVSKPDEKKQEEMLIGSLKGLASSLDHNSSFYDANETKEMRKHTSGKFDGIGIYFDWNYDEKLPQITTAFRDSPAYKAKIFPNDFILKVNGKDLKDTSLSTCYDALQGDSKTPVTITIKREGTDPFDVILKRAPIKEFSIRYKGIIDDENKVGYVAINSFQEETATDFKKAIQQLQKEGMKHLIIDLRDNGGGLLDSAIKISDMFIEKEKIIVSTNYREENEVHRATEDATVFKDGFNIAVLLNDESASASEIVAGALRDHGKAILVGERSYGKGSVQNIIDIANKYTLRLTVAYYYTPSSHCIDRSKYNESYDMEDTPETPRKSGLKPDYEVKFTEDDQTGYQQEKDRLLVLQHKHPEYKMPEQKPEDKFKDKQVQKAIEMLIKNVKVQPRPEKVPDINANKQKFPKAA